MTHRTKEFGTHNKAYNTDNTTETLMDKSIGALVAEDYRLAQVFRNHKIDFCCKGNRRISEVADAQQLDPYLLLQELAEVQRQGSGDTIDFNSWPLDLLTDYIEKKHHRYVESSMPVLKQYLSKLCRVHGERHPELHEIADLFNEASGELAMHMKKEELLLFPAIRKMVAAGLSGATLMEPPFGSVNNPIRQMMQEHDTEGERFRRIDALSDGYTPPQDACNTYRVAFSLLKEFEEDLHRHIHLENNLLFPKSVALEQQFRATSA